MIYLPLGALTLKSLNIKVKRRIKKILLTNLPIHAEYRPKGIVGLAELRESKAIDFIELRAPYLSTLDKSDFYQKCSYYIRAVMASKNPGDYLAIIKDGRIIKDTGSNMAVVSSDGYLISEASFQWNRGLLGSDQNAFLKQKGFTKPKRYQGKVFSLLAGGGATSYYYHWMVDSLPKLFLLKEAGLFDEIDHFLVPNYAFDFQRETLEYLGIKSDRIINGFHEHHIQADYLIVSSNTRVDGHHPKWVCDGLYDTFVGSKPPAGSDRLIYISRADAKQRKVLNEPDLIEMLKRYGFEIHTMSNLSMADKVQLLHSARVIVGPHGSGTVNVVLCRPGTTVLDLIPDNCVAPFMCDICYKKGLIYEYLLCPSDGNATNAVEGIKLNLSVNVDEVEEKIRSLFRLESAE